MYRFMSCKIAFVLSSLVLSACGQSGALQHPTDPQYDQRAKYLIYSQDASVQPASASQSTTP